MTGGLQRIYRFPEVLIGEEIVYKRKAKIFIISTDDVITINNLNDKFEFICVMHICKNIGYVEKTVHSRTTSKFISYAVETIDVSEGKNRYKLHTD